jgi:leader peptidase (prepilin peptidase)/N-methyltransferase
MSDILTQLDTAAACAAAAAVLGGLAPSLVARLPEPQPDPDRPAPAKPKEAYAAIAARPGFRVRTAIWSAVFAALFGAVLGWDLALVYLLPLTPLAVVLSVIDWRTKLLPTRLLVPAYLFLLPVLVVLGLVTRDWRALWLALAAGVVVRGFYWLFWRFTRSGMGFGDVRLAGLIGLALGWLGWGELLVGVYAGFLLGALVGGVLAAAKVLDRKSYPFGPFMLVGAATGVLLGPWLASVSPY